MSFLNRNILFKVLTLLLSIALLFTFMGCAKAEDDVTPSTGNSMVFLLPELNYDYDSLEPFIDTLTMEIHHTKHHSGYVNRLNAALEVHPELDLSIEEMLANPSLVPEDIRTAVQNNGGGYYNHALFFRILKVNDGQTPSGELEEAIDLAFGSFDEFKEVFADAAGTHFGSGWAWLIVTEDGLEVVTTQNQDTPLDQGTPILTIDVWEHAYYLNYQNRRTDYISAFFNVINWDKVAELYDATQ